MGVLQPKSMRIYYDSQSCMAMTKNPEFNGHFEHIEVQFHFMREKVEAREIEFTYYPPMLW